MDNGAVSQHILVTGGSGFVGSAVVRELIKAGNTVVATTTGQQRNTALDTECSWVTWDGTKLPLPDVEWSSFDAVIQLAIPRSLFNFPSDASAVYQLCVQSTFEILDQSVKAGIQRFVLASTGDVVGEGTEKKGALESQKPTGTSNFYGAAKAAAELLVQPYEGTLSTAVIRLFHPYGPGGERFLINRLVHMIMNDQPISIEGENGIRLNPVWIEDVADGFSRAVTSTETGTFHFAGKEVLSLHELILLIGELMDKEPRINHTDGIISTSHWGDCTRAHNLLGFSPQVRLNDGLAKLKNPTA
jgi:UDP-glucose 4-epimerase